MVEESPNTSKDNNEGTRPKRVFTPTIPQRRANTSERTPLQSSFLVQSPKPRESAGKQPRGSHGRSGEGQGRGGRAPTSSLTASGPFSLGPSATPGVRTSGAVTPSVITSTSGMITDPHLRTEQHASSQEVPWWDLKAALGETEWAPQVLGMVQEKQGSLEEAKIDVKPAPCSQSTSFLETPAKSLHLIQMPPILPELDTSSFPVKKKNEDGQFELLDPHSGPVENTDDRVMEGKIGELIVRQSGKVQLKIGNVFFDMSQLPAASFQQDAVAMDLSTHQAFNLGPIVSQLFCTLHVDDLVAMREKEIADIAGESCAGLPS